MLAVIKETTKSYFLVTKSKKKSENFLAEIIFEKLVYKLGKHLNKCKGLKNLKKFLKKLKENKNKGKGLLLV